MMISRGSMRAFRRAELIWQPRTFAAFAAGLALRLFAGMFLLLDLLFAEVVLQTVDALTPEPAVLLHPVGDVPQWRRIETARPPLRTATARDQAGVLQDLEVLGHRRRG